jgi:toxin-antitoxin system PIN domain toxin
VTAFLLDVNVLIALIDPAHVHHDRSHDWFAAEGAGRWATCPLTQNAVVRIVGHPRYPNSPGSPAILATVMRDVCRRSGHEFWPDDISLLDASHIDIVRLLSPSQVTDTYLLALARRHGGKLATLDRRLVTDAVPDGTEHIRLIA